MKRSIIIALIFCLAPLVSNGQEKKLESVYLNFQGKGNVTFMNPLDLGVTLNTKNKWRKFTIGLSGYYPNNRTFTNTNDPNYTYDSYQVLSTSNDTVTFESQGLSNRGIGISIGFLTEFKLFKKLNIVSGVTLTNMINFKKSYYQVGRSHDTGNIMYYENLINEESMNVSYIPVFRTYIGAVFNMGEHLRLTPRINTNIAVHKWGSLLNIPSNGININIILRPSIMLGYKF